MGRTAELLRLRTGPLGGLPAADWRRVQDYAVLAVAAFAGLAAARAGSHPAELAIADPLLSGGAAVAVVLAASRARRWAWVILGGAAAVAADGSGPVLLGVVALAVAVGSAVIDHRSRLAGAVVGAAGFHALLTGPTFGPHGASALLTVAATVPVLVSGYRHAPRRPRRLARRLALALGLLGTAVLLAYAIVAATARLSIQRGIDQLDAGLAAAREGDAALAQARLDAGAASMRAANRQLSVWWAAPSRMVPVLGQNAAALERATEEAATLAQVSADAATEADVERLQIQGGAIDVSAVDTIEGPLREVIAALEQADRALEPADSPWLVPPVDHSLDRLRRAVDDAIPDAELALDGVRVAPGLLGAGEPRRYLVLFTTPVEARGRSGFPGNFAELTLTDGDLEMTRFGRISELEQADQGLAPPERVLTGPEDFLARYGRFAPAQTWRNVTMSPDFPSVAQVAAELYPQSGGSPVDGVMSIDPVALAALLEFIGPVTVPGVAEPLDETTTAQFLLFDQYVTVPDVSARLDLLDELARTAFERITTGDLPGPRGLADALGPAVAGGHLQFVTFTQDEARFLDRLGIDGGLPAVRGDFLAVVTNNAAGNKIDLFLRRHVDYEVQWDPDTGALEARLVVTLTNEAPAAGLPDYVLASSLSQNNPGAEELPTGTNRLYLSVYTPWLLDEATLDGEPAPLESQEELGRMVYSDFLDIGPGETRTLELRLSGLHPAAPRYVLDLASQPMVNPETAELAVTVAGRASIDDVTGGALHGRQVRAEVVLDRSRSLVIRTD